MTEKNESSIIIKKKRHSGHAGHHGGAWKIALADFAMAMMAFFLLMWLITTTTDAEKQSITGYFENPNDPVAGQAPILLPDLHKLTSPERTSSNEYGQSALESFLKTEQKKLSISDDDISQIVKDIVDSVNAGELEVDIQTDRIVIRILENGSFSAGSSELCPEFIPILKKVSKVLQVTPGKVTVSGYTDNVPIQTAIFRSNRELSAVRAVSVAEELLKNKKVHPERFVIQGYGENKPMATNDTIEGRAKNRRVELEIIQGNEPKATGKVITIEKDADTKLLPNIDKIDGDDYSVFPPITDVNFDGKGDYLEKGELGVFDKDALYNYELNDVVVKPKEKSKDEIKADVPEAAKKPDDLGIFKGKEEDLKEKKVPGDLGVFKEDNSKKQQAIKDDLGIFKAKDSDPAQKRVQDELGIFKAGKDVLEQKNVKDDLGIFHEKEGEQTQKKEVDELGVFKAKAIDQKQDKNPDGLGIFKGKEVQDRDDLGIVPEAKPKKDTIIEMDKDVSSKP